MYVYTYVYIYIYRGILTVHREDGLGRGELPGLRARDGEVLTLWHSQMLCYSIVICILTL